MLPSEVSLRTVLPPGGNRFGLKHFKPAAQLGDIHSDR